MSYTIPKALLGIATATVTVSFQIKPDPHTPFT